MNAHADACNVGMQLTAPSVCASCIEGVLFPRSRTPRGGGAAAAVSGHGLQLGAANVAQQNSDANVPAFVSAAAMVGRGRGRPAGSGSKTMITKQNALSVITEAQKAATLRLEDEAGMFLSTSATYPYWDGTSVGLLGTFSDVDVRTANRLPGHLA